MSFGYAKVSKLNLKITQFGLILNIEILNALSHFPMENSHQLVVCFDITWMQIGDSADMKWSLGTCSNYNGYHHYNGGAGGVINQECCLVPGRYKLTCESSDSKRWAAAGGVRFYDHQYCSNFIGPNTRQIVYILGW